MKTLLKLLLPKSVWFYLKSVVTYNYDIFRYIKYSNTFYKFDKKNKIIGKIIYKYHVVEKGLTMPNRRIAFGYKIINSLIDDCNFYLESGYSKKDFHFIHAIEVLNEYVVIHNNEELDITLLERIKKIANNTSILSNSNQQVVTRDEYFKNVKQSFEKFAMSRFSIRDFTNERVDLDLVYNSIKIAQKSPSACNRQPNRVHIITKKKTIETILEVQGGNRGFGHLSDLLLILTSDLSIFEGLGERNEAYLNSGLFAMNILFGLHFNKIGACTLNWSKTRDRDLELRDIVNIPESETITLIIACGNVPDEFSVAISPRSNFKEIITMQDTLL